MRAIEKLDQFCSMRPIYLFMKFVLAYSLRLFYKNQLNINEHRERFGSTIYVSNHPNSFMDPLIIGARNRPVVYFMTRSDVFKWWLNPLLNAVHMLPIYRQQDGENTRDKNTSTFENVNKALYRKRNILIFGEGFTDDTPIRGLKPVKKGAIRMGFGALDACNWNHSIYIAALGLNYTDRNTIGSDFLIVNSDKIKLNDYKEEYALNPNKTINEITRKVELELQNCITYVADEKQYQLHENIMKITGKGMNDAFHSATFSLQERFDYSQKLAHWINKLGEKHHDELTQLNEKISHYFKKLKKHQITNESMLSDSKSEYQWLVLIAPFAFIGWAHTFLPYIAAKLVTEKLFKRKVFWGSVKMILGLTFGGLFVIPIVVLITTHLLPFWWLGILYFILIPEFWRLSYEYGKLFKQWKKKRKLNEKELRVYRTEREDLKNEIEQLIHL